MWYENGTRQQCQAASEERLVAKLEKVAERLTTDAPNLLRPAADLIAWYLSPERHPAGQAWSRKHTHTQRRLCQRFLLPVLGDLWPGSRPASRGAGRSRARASGASQSGGRWAVASR